MTAAEEEKLIPGQEDRAHQAHFTRLGSAFAKRMTRFRDVLRVDQGLAR